MEPARKVFYVYDERMLLHKEHTPKAGDDGKVHVIPEVPERISSIHAHLRDNG
jgi:hypothetical protein